MKSPPALTVIIGHRGTGKSHWLKLVQKLYARLGQSGLFFDLDEEARALSGCSIEKLLQKQAFRKWEARGFAHIIETRDPLRPAFVSCGAGFKFKKEAGFHVIHLQRPSDSIGRILPSRPRLTAESSPFKESQRLFRLREPYYRRQADEAFSRREHFKEAGREDLFFLGLKRSRKKLFSLTLREDLAAGGSLEGFLKKREGWPLRFFELNDQTSSLAFARKAQKLIPPERLLFSSQKGHAFKQLKAKRHWSWDLSLGLPPPSATALSLHKRESQSFSWILKSFSRHSHLHLKLAPRVRNLEELHQGFLWWREYPSRRSFLPRSQDGRWAWFREAFGPETFFYFIREGRAGVPDQPLFASACQRFKKSKSFAAVAGWPVECSATPFEQGPFFEARGIPTLSLPLKRGEMTAESLEILKNMGFVFLAVTAPLKKEAFWAVGEGARGAGQRLQSLNTLVLHKGEWRGFNTDIQGFKVLQKKAMGQKTAVFGGDGVRAALRELLPDALFYSVRKRGPLYGKKSFKPDVLIHAAPRGAGERPGPQGPPLSWRPKLVLDLSYGEDSPGLEYALSIGAAYESGWAVFKAQAKAQRSLFQRLEGA